MKIYKGLIGNNLLGVVNRQDRTWHLDYKGTKLVEGYYKLFSDAEIQVFAGKDYIASIFTYDEEKECDHEFYDFGAEPDEQGRCHICGKSCSWHEIKDDGAWVKEVTEWDYDNEPSDEPYTSILSLIYKAEYEDE